MTPLAPGTQAPDLALRGQDGKLVKLSDLRGQTTVLVFYPFAFSNVCTDQFTLYDELLEEFDQRGAKLYGVSCDAIHSQRAFSEQLGVRIPMLSDFEPKGAVSKAFGVYHEGGFSQRAIVIIDENGVVQWSHQADSLNDLPGANLIFDGLAA